MVALRQASERRRYFVTTSQIGWAQTYNQHYECKRHKRTSPLLPQNDLLIHRIICYSVQYNGIALHIAKYIPLQRLQ